MTEPSAEDRKRACEIVCDWRGDEHMPTVADQALVSAIAAALHAQAEAVCAELGHWSAGAASRYADKRVEDAVLAERKRIFTNLCLSCRAGVTLGLEIAAAIRAGATGEGRDG